MMALSPWRDRGPVHGKPVKMDTIIASVDPVAADAIASRIMGFDPEMIDHIRWSHMSGVGDMNNIEVVGDGVEAVKRVFERATV